MVVAMIPPTVAGAMKRMARPTTMTATYTTTENVCRALATSTYVTNCTTASSIPAAARRGIGAASAYADPARAAVSSVSKNPGDDDGEGTDAGHGGQRQPDGARRRCAPLRAGRPTRR